MSLHKKHLMMYVHMHWAYNYPYAARTWELDDWRRYTTGLKSLGYNTVMIWPMAETMPDPLAPSDRAFLARIQRVIEMLHEEVGFDVWICFGPNAVGNEKASRYTFEDRPYFETDLRLNPGDPEQVEELFRRRRAVFEYIREADAITVIDSDPGGYIGSTNAEFADLLRNYLDLFMEYNPNAVLFYWMWVGWESYNAFWQHVAETGGMPEFNWDKRNWREVVSRMKTFTRQNWGVFASNDLHFDVVEELGVGDRTVFNPYGIIEREPTFPATNYDPHRLAECIGMYFRRPAGLGAMGNSQSHVVQLPHTYLFSHFVQGGTEQDADIGGFARSLVPELGDTIAMSWESLGAGQNTAEMRRLAGALDARADDNFTEGSLSQLLLGGANRFVKDLSLQLLFRAAEVDLMKVVEEGAEVSGSLGTLVKAWSEWQARTGFADRFQDVHGLLSALDRIGDADISAVVKQFSDWRNPSSRHGIVPRLLDVMEKRANGRGADRSV